MVIKASAAADIRVLVKSLSGEDEVAREAAIARLAVIGARAVPHLLNAYRTTSDRTTRATLLRAMEPVGDDRTAETASAAIREGGDIAVRAAAVLRGLLESPHGNTAADALDSLMSTALETAAERRVRLAAIEAVEHVSEKVRDRISAALAHDPDEVIRVRVSSGVSRTIDAEAIWKDALEGHLPDDPAVLLETLQTRGNQAPLSELRRLVDRIRARELEISGPIAQDWRTLRGTIHQGLALRGSRVALYDLRESMERATTQLPASFVSAMQVLGDSACLDAIAAAFSQSTPSDEHWRHMLAGAFRTIAMREKAGKRPAVMKRISTRWPGAAALVRISSQ